VSTPLSERVSELALLSEAGPLSLGKVEEILADKGAAAVICLLCLPFLFPIPLPGVSTIFGLAILLLTVKVVRGNETRLPDRIAKVLLPAQMMKSIAKKSNKLMVWLENRLRPRCVFLTDGVYRWIAGASLVSSAIALALPIPPVIPFTNTIPAFGILLVAMGLMEEDGILVVIGHIIGLCAWAYIIAVGGAAWTIFGEVFDFALNYINK
jgi:hypothetical protein